MRLKTMLLMITALASPLCRVSFAQPTTGPATQPAGPTIVRLTLHPMATSQPALQYELLPPMVDTRPGDAAFKYELADAQSSRTNFDQDGLQAAFLIDADRAAFPIGKATDFMKKASTVWIHDAARCERAHWDSDFRNKGIEALLPFLNHMREQANLVTVEGRLAIAKDDYATADYCIQTNLSMAHQLNDEPFLVQGLVAAGIARMCLEKDVVDWIARDKSPNLFWALTGLPRPYVDPVAIERIERAALAFTYQPYMSQALKGTLPASQWSQVIRFMVRLQHAYKSGSFDLDKNSELQVDREVIAVIAAEAAPARKYLVASGLSGAEAAAMCDSQAIGLCWIQQYRIATDELWKGWSLPYPQARQALRLGNAALDASGQLDHNLLFKAEGSSIVPAKARLNLSLLDRQIALLAVIEALRDFAARHGGELPDSLEKIKDLPIPPDPITGNAFTYHRDQQTATIDAPVPPEFPAASGRTYVLTFTRP